MIDSGIKTLKINAVKINKTLAEGNKSMKKLRAEEQRLFRVQQTKIKIRKREDIVEGRRENKIKSAIKNRLIAPGLSFIDKLKDFFLTIGAGILINNLPQIIESVKKFFEDNKWIVDTLQTVINATGNLFMGLIDIVNFFNPKKAEMEKEREELEKKLAALVGDTDAAEKELGETEKEVDKFVGDQLNERTPEQVKSDFIAAVKSEGLTNVSFTVIGNNFANARGAQSKEFRGTINLPGIGTYKKYEDPGFLNMFPSVKEEATDTFGNSISVKELENRYNTVVRDYDSVTEQLQSEGVEGFSRGGTIPGSVYTSPKISSPLSTSRRGQSIDYFKDFEKNILIQSDLLSDKLESNNELESIVNNLSKLSSFNKKSDPSGSQPQQPQQFPQGPQGPQYRPQPLPQSNERNRRAVEFLGRSGLPQLPATGTYPGQHYGDSRDDNRDGIPDRYHAGQDYDISGPNELFYSRLGGVVTHAGNVGGGYGNVVDIYNKEHNVTERIAEGANILPGIKVGSNVAAGQAVVQGENVSLGGVIHYEIRKGKFKYGEAGSTGFNNTVDPVEFLRKLQLNTPVGNTVNPVPRLNNSELLEMQSPDDTSTSTLLVFVNRETVIAT
tara:strand:+ start:2277 stop:4112 length:1836 start_codon:yes stop_codon:yes gene_type:complete